MAENYLMHGNTLVNGRQMQSYRFDSLDNYFKNKTLHEIKGKLMIFFLRY